MKVRESIHSVFLQNAVLESGMDVGIVNAHEMIAYNELEDEMKLLCENLVFNKTPDATDDMLERTTWERACLDAKKKGKSPFIFLVREESSNHLFCFPY
jgi:5-methyltetrahydrofolate--homocysteine methyltransferase